MYQCMCVSDGPYSNLQSTQPVFQGLEQPTTLVLFSSTDHLKVCSLVYLILMYQTSTFASCLAPPHVQLIRGQWRTLFPLYPPTSFSSQLSPGFLLVTSQSDGSPPCFLRCKESNQRVRSCLQGIACSHSELSEFLWQ